MAALASGSRNGRGTVDLEVEAGSPIRSRFHFERCTDGLYKLAADGQSQAVAGGVMAPVRCRGPHRLVQSTQQYGIDPRAGVPNGELEPPGVDRSRRYFHEARLGELRRGGGR